MRVRLNDEEQLLPAAATVADLLAAAGQPATGIAVAVNGELVPRSQWQAHDLRDDDRVEVVTAVAGG